MEFYFWKMELANQKTFQYYLELNDFTDIRVHLDYNGHDRFTSSQKNNG